MTGKQLRGYSEAFQHTYLGKELRSTLLAYSLRYFWNVRVRSINGWPVLSWEHCTIHFL